MTLQNRCHLCPIRRTWAIARQARSGSLAWDLSLRPPFSCLVLSSLKIQYPFCRTYKEITFFSFRYQRYYVKLFNVIFTYGHVGNNHHVCLLVLKLANVDLSCCKSDTIITLVISCTSLLKELRYGLHISVKVKRFLKPEAYNQNNIYAASTERREAFFFSFLGKGEVERESVY